MKNEQIVIVHDKTESTIVKLAKIIGLVAASPLILFGGIMVMGFVLIMFLALLGSGAAVFHTAAPWLGAVIFLLALVPALRDRISNKKQILILQNKVRQLELELSEVRVETLKAYETAEFHRKLNETKTKTSESVKLN